MPPQPLRPDEVPVELREFYDFDGQVIVDDFMFIERRCRDCGKRAVIKVTWVRRAAQHGRLTARCLPCAGRYKAARLPIEKRQGNYQGGRHVTAQGYVKVLQRGHHRANPASGYVSEHILVMEKQLGRPLLPTENVHHKNGRRDDNRPSNLELWTKAQPAGQRVEDMLIFCKEFLSTYQPEALQRQHRIEAALSN